MDGDLRTVWCGNLSEKVTEDVLYELFLQGGPVQKVSIPKDRDGKQKNYAFVTYKHANSVPYALDLFEGTNLFNRALNMKPRHNVDQQPQTYGHNVQQQDSIQNLNNMLQIGSQMLLGSFVPGLPMDMYGLYAGQGMVMYPNQMINNPYGMNDERRSPRAHPYQRDRERDRHDHHRDRHTSHRSNDYSRSNDHRNNRWNYH